MSSSYTVTRRRVIPSSPERLYALLSDFRQWQHWSPWEGLDPTLQRTYSGAEAGVGAQYAWRGNRKAGEGSMEVTEATPSQRVGIDLRFLKPFKSQADTTFDLTPSAEGTEVTWTMVGQRPLFMRLMGPLINMDKLVGRDFERGLEALDHAARASDQDN